ncbi:MAG: hypothetical protein PHW21_07295 [Candidatus Izemoplasmatales bacterium]|nr:hypothetical protein [Candidatus Izemoplasmatales bacterium]
MERSNLEKYYLSIAPITDMFTKSILSRDNYIKAEVFLAEKYCIKKGNLYRLNNLTNTLKRGIDMIPGKEVNNDGKDDNQIRCISEVSKEN